MTDFRPGWNLSNRSDPIPPNDFVLDAIYLLLRQRATDPRDLPPEPPRHLFLKLDKLSWEYIIGLASKLGRGDPQSGKPTTPGKDSARMSDEGNEAEARYERFLQNALKDPVVAERTFPDKQLRNAVLPMFRRLRTEFIPEHKRER